MTPQANPALTSTPPPPSQQVDHPWAPKEPAWHRRERKLRSLARHAHFNFKLGIALASHQTTNKSYDPSNALPYSTVSPTVAIPEEVNLVFQAAGLQALAYDICTALAITEFPDLHLLEPGDAEKIGLQIIPSRKLRNMIVALRTHQLAISFAPVTIIPTQVEHSTRDQVVNLLVCSSTNPESQRSSRPCRNGDQCYHLKRGSCKFTHATGAASSQPPITESDATTPGHTDKVLIVNGSQKLPCDTDQNQACSGLLDWSDSPSDAPDEQDDLQQTEVAASEGYEYYNHDDENRLRSFYPYSKSIGEALIVLLEKSPYLATPDIGQLYAVSLCTRYIAQNWLIDCPQSLDPSETEDSLSLPSESEDSQHQYYPRLLWPPNKFGDPDKSPGEKLIESSLGVVGTLLLTSPDFVQLLAVSLAVRSLARTITCHDPYRHIDWDRFDGTSIVGKDEAYEGSSGIKEDSLDSNSSYHPLSLECPAVAPPTCPEACTTNTPDIFLTEYDVLQLRAVSRTVFVTINAYAGVGADYQAHVEYTSDYVPPTISLRLSCINGRQ